MARYFVIHYVHEDCPVQPGIEWTDEWDCACNGECPACETSDIEPVDWEEKDDGLEDEDVCRTCGGPNVDGEGSDGDLAPPLPARRAEAMSDRDPLLAILRGLYNALAYLANTTHWAAGARESLSEVDRLLREQEQADRMLREARSDEGRSDE